MVAIRPVRLDCTIYMLGAFAFEVSRLIGTCMYVHYLRLDITIMLAPEVLDTFAECQLCL